MQRGAIPYALLLHGRAVVAALLLVEAMLSDRSTAVHLCCRNVAQALHQQGLFGLFHFPFMLTTSIDRYV